MACQETAVENRPESPFPASLFTLRFSAGFRKDVGGVGVAGMFHVEAHEIEIDTGNRSKVNLRLVQIPANLIEVGRVLGEIDEVMQDFERANSVLDDSTGIAAHSSEAESPGLPLLLVSLPRLGFNRDWIHLVCPQGPSR